MNIFHSAHMKSSHQHGSIYLSVGGLIELSAIVQYLFNDHVI